MGPVQSEQIHVIQTQLSILVCSSWMLTTGKTTLLGALENRFLVPCLSPQLPPSYSHYYLEEVVLTNMGVLYFRYFRSSFYSILQLNTLEEKVM